MEAHNEYAKNVLHNVWRYSWWPSLWALALLALIYVNTVSIDSKCGFITFETTMGLAGLDFLIQRSQNTPFCSRLVCLGALELRASQNSVKTPVRKWWDWWWLYFQNMAISKNYPLILISKLTWTDRCIS